MPLRELVNNLPSMVGYWDKNLCNVFCNNAYKKFFNYTPEEIKGKHIREVLGVELFQKNKAYMERALKGERVTFERDIRSKNGEIRQTIVEYIPAFDENNSVIGFYVLVNDITDIKKVEKEKEELHQKLVQNSKMFVLGEMAGGIAHEINNPLSIISLNANMLAEMLESEQINKEMCKKMVGTIQATTNRIAKIVTGLLYFARENSDDLFLKVTLKSVLDETFAFCSQKLRKRQVCLHVEPYNEGIEIECVPVQISQVLLNLISNATDAIADSSEKKITIKINESANLVEISVTDSGKGIDPQIAEKIMQPFFTTKEVGKGTGLGLSISKGIIEKHAGQINLNRQAKNTTFVITLPKVRSKY